MNPMYIAIGVGAVVVLFIIFYIQISINEKKGVDSEDKKTIQNIVKRLVPDADTYTAAYGVWEEINFGGGRRSITTTTKYWYYAVAFKPGNIHVIPLSYEGGDVSYGKAISLTKDDLGMVNAKAGDCWVSFYDKNQQEIVSVIVGPSNTKDDKYHPVNIQQKEEYEAFVQFIKEFMMEVNESNHVTVTGKVGKPLKKAK